MNYNMHTLNAIIFMCACGVMLEDLFVTIFSSIGNWGYPGLW